MYKNLEIANLLDFYGGALTQKQRDVLELYYNEDLSLSEIAENFGITRQGVRDSIKRGEGVLLELEDKVGFAQKYRVMQSSLEEMDRLAQNIEFFNGEASLPSLDIQQSAQQLRQIIGGLAD